MSTQWKINLILNIRFTCIGLNLSCTINTIIPIKSKIGGKIFSKNYAKTGFCKRSYTKESINNQKAQEFVPIVDVDLSVKYVLKLSAKAFRAIKSC